jgi:hypothetical protein
MKKAMLALAWLLVAFGPPAGAQEKDLKTLLKQKVTVEFDHWPLQDALGYVEEKYGIPMELAVERFKKDVNIPFVAAQPVKLKRTTDTLDGVLKKILDQVKGEYIIRKGELIIVPKPKIS